MHSEPGGGWEGPMGPPLETLPGPSNPWAACSGGGGGSNTGMKPAPDIDPPRVPPDVMEGSAGFNRDQHDWGVSMVVIGLVGLALGGAMAAFGTAVAIAAGPIEIAIVAIGLAGLVIVAAAMAAFAGLAAMVGAIDPPVLRHDVRAKQPPRRKISIPAGTPTAWVNLLLTAHELEHLAHGEVQLYDLARAAAAAKDADWYEIHVRDLYTVQTRKQHFMQVFADNLEALLQGQEDLFGQVSVPTDQKIMDVANPISDLRGQLGELGMTSGEIDGLLHDLRLPSGSKRGALDEAKRLIADHKGESAGLVKMMARNIRQMEAIDWPAFRE